MAAISSFPVVLLAVNDSPVMPVQEKFGVSMIVLRKLLSVFLICLLVKAAFSQEQHYIYIQSDDHRSFYVRLGAEVFASSGNGYLVIPGLGRNTYELIVGFPEGKATEWRFSCTVSEADLGFILKRKSAAELQLLNLGQQQGETGTIVEQRTEVKTSAGAQLPGGASSDAFSLMLADVVNDPSIRHPVIVEQKIAPPVLASGESPAPPSIADVLSVAGQHDTAAVAVAPVVTNAKSASPGIAGNGAEKPGSDLKEPEKTVVAPADKSSKEEAVEKAGSAVAVNTEKKYEPFVIKETPLQGNAKAADAPAQETATSGIDPAKKTESLPGKEPIRSSTEKARPTATAGVENNSGSDEVKYLPFVIKPGAASQQSEEAQQRKADPAIVVADERKDVSPVVKKDNKQPEGAEKEKSLKTGVVAKDNAVAAVATHERKSTPTGKNAVLSSVKKTLERRGRDGVDLIYIDENINGARDTIRIFIPGVK